MNDYWKYILWIFLFWLVSDYFRKTQNLKEEIKEKHNLNGENYNLKKKIDDLEEKNNVLKIEIDSLEGIIDDLTGTDDYLGIKGAKDNGST